VLLSAPIASIRRTSYRYVDSSPATWTDPLGLANYVGVNEIEAHLEHIARAQGDDFWTNPNYAPERDMLSRIKRGEETPWDIAWYHHEKAEADACKPYRKRPYADFRRKQREVHDFLEQRQGTNSAERYHPNVISRYPQFFR
jgi:hypothetical protein